MSEEPHEEELDGNCISTHGRDLEIVTSPGRTYVHCVAEGCSRMNLKTECGTECIAFEMTDCPCVVAESTLCIDEWHIECGEMYLNTFVLTDEQCTGACCGGIIEELQRQEMRHHACGFSNETLYVCEEAQKCDVDCEKHMLNNQSSMFNCSAPGAVIDGSRAVVCVV